MQGTARRLTTSLPSYTLLCTFRYLIFYSPFDIVYKICKFLPIKIVIAMMKEVIRCKKINDGVGHAAHLYPNSYLIMVIIGTVKGEVRKVDTFPFYYSVAVF